MNDYEREIIFGYPEDKPLETIKRVKKANAADLAVVIEDELFYELDLH
ncbi:MAG: hypothetical protein ACRCXT_05460 [Paraclostridium sp.]